jgi:prepilin-type N-terminal cleavage/methylation domain-containing protein/prepilin-type processing-associated H-X9-DG protein
MLNDPNRRSRPAFTLVELLVVIGIIALLISILLPSLNKARRAADMVACSSNMRQIGMAFRMYAGDNKDAIPFAYLRDDTGQIPQSTWDMQLDKYMGGKGDAYGFAGAKMPTNTAPYLCPADTTLMRNPSHTWNIAIPGPNGTVIPKSYAMTYGKYPWEPGAQGSGTGIVYVRLSDGSAGDESGVNVDGKRNTPIRYSTVRNATECLLLVERADPLNMIGSGIYGGGSRTQGPYGQHPGNRAFWLHPTTGGTGVKAGRWNYLFMDGHVAPLYETETVDMTNASRASTLYSNTFGLAPGKYWTITPND